MLVSINIVAYNEEKNIKKSLTSAFSQSYRPIEVFLIDNASRDKTIERAREIDTRDTPFKIIKNLRNLGFGGGHNVGFKESRGELVLCLNADCELDKDYVKYAIEVFEKNVHVGGVQGKLQNPRTKKIDTAGLLIFKNRRVINRGQGKPDTGQYDEPQEIWGVDGAAPLYRRGALDDTKIWNEHFDEDFFAYKEDVDLSWRMRLAGWKMYYEPRAIARHDRSAGEGTAKNIFEIIKARKGISDFSKYHSFANQRLMQIKNESPMLFLKHAYLILPKEILAWTYVLLFERYGWRSALKFLKLQRRMFQKRKVVMSKKRINDADMERWLI